MEAKATEHFFPHWQNLAQSPTSRSNSRWASDARRTSHPIQQPVANESEATAVFDGITYSKGQALIRMLESYLGEDTFRAGIRNYTVTHAYGNTVTGDLWRALEKASGKPVAAIAGSFTEQAGVPLIIAESSCDGEEQRIHVRQERFTVRDPDVTPRRWKVPLALAPLQALPTPETVLLDEGEMEIAVGRCGEPVKLNLGDIGYYRVEYDTASRAALVKSFALMTAADRTNLLADGWALMKAGRSDPQSYFELTEEIRPDEDRAVLEQIIHPIARLNRLARGRIEQQALQSYGRAKLRPILARLGWDAAGAEDDESMLLRNRVILTLAELKDEEVIAEASRRFGVFLQTRQL